MDGERTSELLPDPFGVRLGPKGEPPWAGVEAGRRRAPQAGGNAGTAVPPYERGSLDRREEFGPLGDLAPAERRFEFLLGPTDGLHLGPPGRRSWVQLDPAESLKQRAHGPAEGKAFLRRPSDGLPPHGQRARPPLPTAVEDAIRAIEGAGAPRRCLGGRLAEEVRWAAARADAEATASDSRHGVAALAGPPETLTLDELRSLLRGLRRDGAGEGPGRAGASLARRSR